MRRYEIKISETGINTSHIERVIGFGGGAPEPFGNIIAELIEKLKDKPIRGEYRVFEDFSIDVKAKTLTVRDKTFSVGAPVLSGLKDSEKIAIILCSAGESISDLLNEYPADPVSKYIVDTLGSEIAEHFVDLIHRDINRVALEEHKNTSNRYSPGYCGWDIKGQKGIFELMDGHFTQISLNNSMLMTPIKSISTLVGIGEKVRFRQYSCRVCADQNCIYKNINRKK